MSWSRMGSIVSWITFPKGIQVLIPRTSECILYHKRDFTDVITLRILRWEDCSELRRCALIVIPSVLIKGGRSGYITTYYRIEKEMW